jgi:precorrin-4/cobalt-precorrin-4 C11-methyltransferase
VTTGRVAFVGCGPGAADLLTLRAARLLAEADVVVWSASLIDAEVVDAHARPGTEIVAWPPATRADVLAVYERAREEGLRVVRLKGGDPGLFGALEPELGAVCELGLGCEIVPGVSSLSAAAAELGRELAATGAPLLLVAAGDLDGGAPDAAGTAVFGAGRDPGAIERALLARGLPAATPCAVAVAVSRPAQIVAACALGELAEHVADLGLGAQTLVIAAPALAADDGRGPHD